MIKNEYPFINTRFPYLRKEEAVSGKLKNVMNQFSKWRYDHTLLFHSYCDLIGVTEKSFTLWKDVKFGKGIPVIGGVAVDETLLEKYVWTIRKVPADQLISLLFYSGDKNLSAYESGFLVPIVLAKDPKGTYILNPSSYMVKDTIGQCKGYVVWDEHFCLAYSDCFKKNSFFSYDDMDKLEEDCRILAEVDEDRDMDALVRAIAGTAPKELVVSIPQVLFKKTREVLLQTAGGSGLTISNILLMDTAIFPANPKKRMVLFFRCDIPKHKIPARILSLQGVEMVLEDEVYHVSDDYLQTGMMTIRDVIRMNTPAVEVQKRKRPEEYWFSREIRIRCKYTARDGKKVAIVSYNSIPDAAGRSRKISRNIEKGLRFTDENDLKNRLDQVVFLDELSEIIARDVRKSYADRFETLSMKTLWYLYRDRIYNNEFYDDALCMSIFVDSEQELQKMSYSDFLTGRCPDVLEEVLVGRDTAEQRRILLQLDILFDALLREGIFRYNPFRDMLGDLSNRMSEEQYEVRNALVKKNLSISQQKALLAGTCQTGEWLGSEDFRTLVVSFRLLSGIPVREMLALKWSDLVHVEDYDFYQIQVTMRIDREGKSVIYGTQDDWKRFRLIPLVPELTRQLFIRKQRWMAKYKLTEEKMLNLPIFCENYDRRRKQQQIMRYEVVNRICRDTIAALKIPKFEVRLPGEKELITNLNRYYSDLFLSNFRYHANHTCRMTRGEINYLLGLEQEDTYAKHYFDYTNDALQYQMLRKLIRWSVLLRPSGDRSDAEDPAMVECVECRIQAERDKHLQIKLRSQFGGTARVMLLEEDEEVQDGKR